MAKRKDTSPLFEIIHNAGQPSEPNVRIPEWLRKQQEQARQGGRSEPAEADPQQARQAHQPREPHHPNPQQPPAEPGQAPQEAQDPPAPPAPASGPGLEPEPAPELEATEEPIEPEQCSASSAAATTGKPGSSSPIGSARWLGRLIVLRLGRGGALALAALGLLLLVGTFVLGWQLGRSAALSRQQSYQNLVQSVQDDAGSAEEGLIPSSVRGVEAQAAGPAPASAAVLDPENDPRDPGLNYFRLETFPDNGREAGQEAVQFLRGNGVDAALIPINNRNSLKLVALRGFESPYSDPAAQRFKRELQSFGREWKAQHGGSSDWKDMIPEKYRPGAN